MKNGNLIVRADLPGFDPKDVEISVLGNVLTIRGERKEEKEVKKVITPAGRSRTAPWSGG